MTETPKPRPHAPNRAFELAKGIRVSKNPDLMDRDELVDALDNLAEFASRILIEKVLLSKTITDAMTKTEKRD